MNEPAYADDHRLDILVLGSMDEQGVRRLNAVEKALKALLKEAKIEKLLAATHTLASDVHTPTRFHGQEIVHNVLSWLDMADLVVVDLTPQYSPQGPMHSPNVYWELGLVQALDLPVILLVQAVPPMQGKVELPFYFLTSRRCTTPAFTVPALKKALRESVQQFIAGDSTHSFGENRITQFYGLPLVDISATVGLATGYYHNFVGRLLRDGSFISLHPDKIRHLVIVRPHDVLDTYKQDSKLLQTVLDEAGFALQLEQLKEPDSDPNGPIWITHVDGIVLDLPRTIYPLKSSPRLLALQERLNRSGSSPFSRQQRELVLRQHSQQLVRRMEQAIWYHVDREREGYRKTLLEFASIAEVPAVLRRLGARPTQTAAGS